MKEISDNDYRALELARELFALKAEQNKPRTIRELAEHFGNEKETQQGRIFANAGQAIRQKRDRIERIDWALEAWAKGEDIIAAMLADPRDDKSTRDTLAFHHSAWAKAAMRNAITMQHTTSGNAIHTNVTLNNVPLANALDNSLAAFGNALDHFNKQKGA